MKPYFEEDGIQIFHGDCREVLEGLPAGTFDLVVADPPYGLSKEAVGVANDNLHGAKLDRFQMEWWTRALRCMREKSSAYIWGLAADLWRLWYCGGLKDSDPDLMVASEIVWKKDLQVGQRSPKNRSFVESERALFLHRGAHKFSINADAYFEGYEPIRAYLAAEVEKAGFSHADVGRITGTKSMWPRWFSDSQWHMMRRVHYEELAGAAEGLAFLRGYDGLRAQFELAKERHDVERSEFYQSRAYFAGGESTTDVWSFPVPKGYERFGHATPKPVAAMVRAISASCPPGGVVLDPFGGCCPVARAAKDLGVRCVAIELEEKYCEIAAKRLAQGTLGFY